MAKKFKMAAADDEGTAQDTPIGLLDYIQHSAPEVLTPLPIMAGEPALNFWKRIFQPVQTGEGRRRLQDCWRWPYAERLVYLAREFIRLDEPRRLYIVKAAGLQIWWRGDDMQRFRQIVAAHCAYRRLNAEEQAGYRKCLMNAAKAVARSRAA